MKPRGTEGVVGAELGAATGAGVGTKGLTVTLTAQAGTATSSSRVKSDSYQGSRPIPVHKSSMIHWVFVRRKVGMNT